MDEFSLVSLRKLVIGGQLSIVDVLWPSIYQRARQGGEIHGPDNPVVLGLVPFGVQKDFLQQVIRYARTRVIVTAATNSHSALSSHRLQELSSFIEKQDSLSFTVPDVFSAIKRFLVDLYVVRESLFPSLHRIFQHAVTERVQDSAEEVQYSEYLDSILKGMLEETISMHIEVREKFISLMSRYVFLMDSSNQYEKFVSLLSEEMFEGL